MDARNLLSLSGVLLVLGAAGYYWGMGHQRGAAPDAAEAPRPDYVITAIRSQETDEAGRLLRRLEATELRHYDRPREMAEVDRPSLVFYEQGQEAWRVQARRGTSLNDNREVHLEGSVHAERRDPAAQPLTLDTDALTVFPREQRLATRADVAIASPQGRLTSRGLEARLQPGEIVLSENVTGIYAPAPR